MTLKFVAGHDGKVNMQDIFLSEDVLQKNIKLSVTHVVGNSIYLLLSSFHFLADSEKHEAEPSVTAERKPDLRRFF